jgi:hypothetical protein
MPAPKGHDTHTRVQTLRQKDRGAPAPLPRILSACVDGHGTRLPLPDC